MVFVAHCCSVILYLRGVHIVVAFDEAVCGKFRFYKNIDAVTSIDDLGR